jgi:hypothetical protein
MSCTERAPRLRSGAIRGRFLSRRTAHDAFNSVRRFPTSDRAPQHRRRRYYGGPRMRALFFSATGTIGDCCQRSNTARVFPTASFSKRTARGSLRFPDFGPGLAWQIFARHLRFRCGRRTGSKCVSIDSGKSIWAVWNPSTSLPHG